MHYGQKAAGQKIPNSTNGTQGVQTPYNPGKLIRKAQNKDRNRVSRARKYPYTVF